MSREFWIRVLLIAVTVAVYVQVAGHGFVEFDDPDYVRDNPIVQHGLTYRGIEWAFTTGFASNWHPVTWISLMADAEIHRTLKPLLSRVLTYDANGLCPGGYHLTNVALHVVNVLLLFGILKAMTGAVWRSAIVAAMLAVHPIHVESVAWVTERKDVLALFFWLLTMWAYLRFLEFRDVRGYVMVMVFMALGLMSKPMLVTMPFVLLLVDWWPLGRIGGGAKPQALVGARGLGGGLVSAGRMLLEKVPLVGLAIGSSVVTWWVQIGQEDLSEGMRMALPVRLANAAVSYVRYLGKMFWPTDLAMLYPNPSLIGRESWTAMQVGLACAVLILVSLAAIVWMRKRPYLLFGWLWFLGTMVPVIGLVQIGRHSMADRYAYIPFVGLYVMAAWGVADLTTRWRKRSVVRWPVAACVVIVLGAMAFQQAALWKDTFLLFEDTLRKTEGNWLVRHNLAFAYENEGKLDDGVRHLQAALLIYPESPLLHDHLGATYCMQGKLFEGQREFEMALAHDPKFVRANYNLAITLFRRGQGEKALGHFQAALLIDPNDQARMKYFNELVSGRANYEQVLEVLRSARSAAPESATAYDEMIARVEATRSGGKGELKK